VVYGVSIDKMRKMIRSIQKISPIKGVCIGGMVPLIRTQIANGRKLMVNLLIELRNLLPDSFIHVLGVGGTTTMHLMFYLGVDSVDSCSWEKKAAYGLIQLPRVGDRFIVKRSSRKRYPVLSPEEYKTLLDCPCPICRKHSPQELDKYRNFRVIHNAWVFQNEVREARRRINDGVYEKFVKDRIRHSNMYSTFRYAQRRFHEEV